MLWGEASLDLSIQKKNQACISETTTIFLNFNRKKMIPTIWFDC